MNVAFKRFALILIFGIILSSSVTLSAKGGMESTDGLDYVGDNNVRKNLDYYSLYDKVLINEKRFEIANRDSNIFSTAYVDIEGSNGDCSPETEYDTHQVDGLLQLLGYTINQDILTDYYQFGSYAHGGMMGAGISVRDTFSAKVSWSFTDAAHLLYYPSSAISAEISIMNVYARCVFFNPDDSPYNIHELKLNYEAGYAFKTSRLDSPVLNKSVIYSGIEQTYDTWKLKLLIYDVYPVEFIRTNLFLRYNLFNNGVFDLAHGDGGFELDLIIGERLGWNLTAGAGCSFSNKIRDEATFGYIVHAALFTPVFGFENEDQTLYWFAARLRIDCSLSWNYPMILNYLPLLNHPVYTLSLSLGV